jgi:outer membrane biosynthesis protein TonB
VPQRRSGLVVLLVLFLGVNSVVLALVVWDKIEARLPWRGPGRVPATEATATPLPAPSVVPMPEPTSAPIVIVEQTPAGTPAPLETPPPQETPTPEPSPAPTSPPTPTVAPSLPPGAIPPVRTSDVRPVFPDELMRRHAGLDGRVEMEVLVQEDGSIGSIRVVRGVDPEIDGIVVEAARRQLGFTPAMLRRGRATAARATVVVGVRFRVASPAP